MCHNSLLMPHLSLRKKRNREKMDGLLITVNFSGKVEWDGSLVLKVLTLPSILTKTVLRACSGFRQVTSSKHGLLWTLGVFSRFIWVPLWIIGLTLLVCFFFIPKPRDSWKKMSVSKMCLIQPKQRWENSFPWIIPFSLWALIIIYSKGKLSKHELG